MTGQVTTCYSFKGGSGRSMSLANMAWVLATHGKKVLVVDWDLEAPGLHRYFHPFLADPLQQESSGLIDALWAYVNAVPEGAIRKQPEWAALTGYVQRLSLPLEGAGAIDLLGAGRQDSDYTTKVGKFDWDLFYSRFGGESYIDCFGRWARSGYDHILIDSRTGVADTAGICTVQLPDVLALFFVYNRQSIEGAAAAGRAVRNARQAAIRIVPCPSRVEDKRIAAPARQYAALCLEAVMHEAPKTLARVLRVNEMMHFPWCSYEEKLAVFEEEPDESGTLLQATQALSDRVAGPFQGSMEVVERDRLNAIWRRAAFRDPRMYELEGARPAPTAQKLSLYGRWLTETLADANSSPSWELALAGECILLATSLGGLQGGDADALGQGAVTLARRALKDGGTDRAGVAEILVGRASSLARLVRMDEADALAEEAALLLRSDDGTEAQVVRARALQVRADLASRRGEHDVAVRHLDEIVDMLDGRRLDASSQEARARAYYARASLLLEGGDYDGARSDATKAMRLFLKVGSDTGREIVQARLVAVRASLAARRPDAALEAQRFRRWAKRQSLPEALRCEVEIRLTFAEADALREAGDLDRARSALDALGPDLPLWASAELAELAARIEVVGALDLPAPGETTSAAAGKLELEQVLELLRRALARATNDETRRKVIHDYLAKSTATMGIEGGGLDSVYDVISRALPTRRPDELD